MSLLLLLRPREGSVAVVTVTGMFDQPTPTAAGYDSSTPSSSGFDQPTPGSAHYDSPTPS